MPKMQPDSPLSILNLGDFGSDYNNVVMHNHVARNSFYIC